MSSICFSLKVLNITFFKTEQINHADNYFQLLELIEKHSNPLFVEYETFVKRL